MINKSGWDFASQVKWLDNYLQGHEGFIAGGAFKSIFSDQKVKDLDIFFETPEAFEKAVTWFKNITNTTCEPVYEWWYSNNNVVAYRHRVTKIVCELNRKIFGTPEQILSSFDFTISKFAYYAILEPNFGPDGNLWADQEYVERYYCMHHEDYFQHLNQHRLVIDNDVVYYPASTFERMFKYGKQGYFPCRQTKIKMIEALRAMPDGWNISASMYDGVD